MTRLQAFTAWVLCLFFSHEPSTAHGPWQAAPLHCGRCLVSLA